MLKQIDWRQNIAHAVTDGFVSRPLRVAFFLSPPPPPHTQRTSLFSRRPSSRHFYLTARCAPQQPIGADVPMQPPGRVITTVIKKKKALTPSPWCITVGKQSLGTRIKICNPNDKKFLLFDRDGNYGEFLMTSYRPLGI